MAPLVSVVLPVYNVECYLRQCLDSIVGQTLKELEIICVDDGSTDGSPDILREYAEKDARIHILHQNNQTLGPARNNGMKLARGKYLVFLDSDDFFAPDMLEAMAARAEETSADIVLCAYRRFDSATGEYTSQALGLNDRLLKEYPVFSRTDFPDQIIQVTAPNVWTKLFRRAYIEENAFSFSVLGNSEDVCFTYLSICLADRIAWVPDAYVSYRVGRADSLESRKGEHPLCFIAADRALYDELHRHGIFQEVEKGYVNRTINGIAYVLNRLKRPSDRALACQVLDRDFYPYTKLLDHPDEYYLRPKLVRELRELRRRAAEEREAYDRANRGMTFKEL